MKLDLSGLELHYDVHGDGEPLLWLHGWLGVGADWQVVFHEPPAGFQVIAPDLRGHGRSTGAAAVHPFQQQAVDVAALLDHLGIERVKVIGLSGGGIAALHLAAIDPLRVAAMAIVSAPARFPEQARAIQRAFALEAMPDAERARHGARHPRAGQLEALVAQVRAFADAGDPDFSDDDLARIAADTLIVFGDRDPLYPVSLAVDLHRAIPRSWLWVVPNGGHGPIFGADAPAFVRTVLAFFRGAYREPAHGATDQP